MSTDASRTIGPEVIEWGCPAGHRWGGGRDVLSVCPQCGERGAPIDPASESATTFGRRAARMPLSTVLMPGGALPTVPGYEVFEELGRGGMGVVYKARQTGLNRLVGLKMILPGARSAARFQTEAKAVAQLSHPAIVQVYEVGAWQPGDGGPAVPFYSMEYCPGGSLEQFLDRNAPLPPRDAASIVAALARAIAHAHAHGVIHRDLKPGNVLLAREVALAPGDATQPSHRATDHPAPKKHAATLPAVDAIEPKVADFGLARLADEQRQTQTGDVLGTPSYMSPEQAEGKADVGPAADVWALGAILYECLAGRAPFRGSTSLETMLLVMNEEPVAPRRLNPLTPIDLDTICLKCLRKDPRRRYESAEALADDLGRYLCGEPILARPVGTAERVWRWAAQNRLAASLMAAVFLLLLTVAVTASLLAWSLAVRHAALAANRGDVVRQIDLARQDVADGRARLGAAEQAMAKAALAREQMEQKLWAVEAEVVRDRAAGQGATRKGQVNLGQAAELRRTLVAAHQLEERAKHDHKKVIRELRERETRVEELERLLLLCPPE